MTAIEWDKIDERIYEIGVDRGILNIDGSSVLPWNGLVKISENEVDRTALRSQYDGVTYIDLQFGGFFQATVTAFSFPNGFFEIFGLAEVFPGMFFTGQARAPFDFAYRSLIGEDEHKLHIVHNATIIPKKSGAATIKDNIDAEQLEWVINAIPTKTTLHRPTSHLVLDTSKADPSKVTILEDTLYGTDDDDPYFPAQQEIIDMFS